MESRLLGPTLSIVRKERIARSLHLVNTVSRTSPTKGKFLNNTTPPTYINTLKATQASQTSQTSQVSQHRRLWTLHASHAPHASQAPQARLFADPNSGIRATQNSQN